jgi:hypothetical protein
MKPITERIDNISIHKGKDECFNRHSDRISIWGSKGSVIFPLVYITKPKSVSIEDWEVIKEKLEINLLK